MSTALGMVFVAGKKTDISYYIDAAKNRLTCSRPGVAVALAVSSLPKTWWPR